MFNEASQFMNVDNSNVPSRSVFPCASVRNRKGSALDSRLRLRVAAELRVFCEEV